MAKVGSNHEGASINAPIGPANRRTNRKSTIKIGRTIGEKREHLETANERAAARKKDKRKKNRRILIVSVVFLVLIGILAFLAISFLSQGREDPISSLEDSIITDYEPTIEIIDEDAAATGGNITGRMRQYIGQAESDFKDLGYVPVKAILPANAVREIDIYLEGYSGYIKLVIDRDAAVSTEDADRMIRYLAEQGISTFQYIDVRVDGRGYWR